MLQMERDDLEKLSDHELILLMHERINNMPVIFMKELDKQYVTRREARSANWAFGTTILVMGFIFSAIEFFRGK